MYLIRFFLNHPPTSTFLAGQKAKNLIHLLKIREEGDGDWGMWGESYLEAIPMII